MTTTAHEALVDLRATQATAADDTTARRALLASAINDGWFAVRITDDVTAYMEPTRGLLAGDTYRIVYAYASGDVAVIERQL